MTGARDSGPRERARADQIATLFAQWGRTTSSMTLGGLILCAVMWNVAPHRELALWLAAILVNQAWRWELARRYRLAAPPPQDRERWGRAWAVGSTIAGALWGAAGLLWFASGDIGHQALLIVCLFGVIMGGLYLTSVYRPTLYGFALPALAPLIVRVALEGDQLHAFIAAVLTVVLCFILRFGHSLNELMSQSLAMRHENVDLIGELQAQTAAADRARATAEAANRGKTQFLAAASHDLRQPLHAMGLFAAALSARAQDLQLRHLVASITASVEALERSFSALMDISKLDAGAMAPRRTTFPLQPLFERLEREFAPAAAAKGLRFAVVPTRAWVESDPVLLERILANLASNAVRYTARGGVVIGARRRGDRVAVDTCDSGVGIPAAERERIFEEFYQVACAGSRGGSGMGLGLAIIRRLAALLEHRLGVQSQPGKGSTFRLEVPRASAIVAPAVSSREATGDQATPLTGLCIAVVDDEEIVLQGMRALLEAWGASVIGASCCEAMLAALGEAESYPDLIIADYRIRSDELGTEVIARLRRELGIPVPSLLISGDSSAATLEALRCSGQEFLLKPVLPEELRAQAARLCARRPPGRAGARGAGVETPLGFAAPASA
ncbi:MAG TPA: hybrid sensor histidine kinase/response regulator [Casimicrobiaceae bacterium]|nr:hybrid sensor histidine kinase/response regulator [Casimicrobiaceae bacterium]